MSLPRAVGLVGYPNAGKSTMAGVMAEFGYETFAGSQILKDVAAVEGFESDDRRDSYMPLWRHIASSRGPAWLMNEARERADGSPFVFDGLRIKEDAQELIKFGDVWHICSTTSEELARSLSRGRSDDEYHDLEDVIDRRRVEDEDGLFNQAAIKGLASVHFSLPHIIRGDNMSVEVHRERVLQACKSQLVRLVRSDRV